VPAILDSPMNPKRYLKFTATTSSSSVPPGSSPALQFTTKDWAASSQAPVFAVYNKTIQGIATKYYEVASLENGVTKKWYIRQGNTVAEYTLPAPNQPGAGIPPAGTIPNPGTRQTIRQDIITPSPALFGLILVVVLGIGLGTWYYWDRKRSR
jgi:hypothetical protein